MSYTVGYVRFLSLHHYLWAHIVTKCDSEDPRAPKFRFLPDMLYVPFQYLAKVNVQ